MQLRMPAEKGGVSPCKRPRWVAGAAQRPSAAPPSHSRKIYKSYPRQIHQSVLTIVSTVSSRLGGRVGVGAGAGAAGAGLEEG